MRDRESDIFLQAEIAQCARGVGVRADQHVIQALQRRGAVFLACHNAIWEASDALIRSGSNPDKLSHEALAAELTNHLIPDVVLTPGAVATLLELQQAGFQYAT